MAWLDLCVALFVILLPNTFGVVFWGIGIKNINDSSIIDKHASAAITVSTYIETDECFLRAFAARFHQSSPNYKVFYTQIQVLYSDKGQGLRVDAAGLPAPGSIKKVKSPNIRHLQPVSAIQFALYSLMKAQNCRGLCRKTQRELIKWLLV